MKKYYINGKEVSALEKAKHKLKQLNEASELLEEISDRCAWADDCAEYNSIKDVLDPVYTAAERAKDEIDEMIYEIEHQIEDHDVRIEAKRIETEEVFDQNIEPCLA
jgi:hypothetical protein